MRGFQRHGDGYRARLDEAERRVLLDVVDGVIDLFGEVAEVDDHDPFAALRIGEGPVEPPQDPALHRLLPDASDDPEIAAELRRLTESDLRSAKVSRLRALRAALEGEVVQVDPGSAQHLAAALTDVRLVVASRLGLEDDDQAEAVYLLATTGEVSGDEADTTRRFLAAVYTVLTQFQESLVELMVSDLPG